MNNPWWASLVTASGPVVAIVIAQAVLLRIESQRRKQEHTDRWLERKQAAYVDFLVAARELHQLIEQVQKRNKKGSPESLDNIDKNIRHSSEAVMILAPTSVSKHIPNIMNLLGLMMKIDAFPREKISPETKIDLDYKLDQASSTLIEEINYFTWVARADLGIPFDDLAMRAKIPMQHSRNHTASGS